jgi:hypothetical protein
MKIIVLGIGALLVAASTYSKGPSRTDSSGLTYRAEEYRTPICSGKLNEPRLLTQIAVTEKEFEEGIQCARGDYDGNGYLDFVLFSPIEIVKQTIYRKAGFTVVFFGKDGIAGSHHITDRTLTQLETYGAGGGPGEFGEPSTKVDGLVEWGEGGSTRLLLFDNEKKAFVQTEYASENH